MISNIMRGIDVVLIKYLKLIQLIVFQNKSRCLQMFSYFGPTYKSQFPFMKEYRNQNNYIIS